MAPWAFPPSKRCSQSGRRTGHCKYAGILACILGPHSADLESENSFFKEASQLRSSFFGTFLPSSRWSRDTVEMQGIELATIFGAPSAFQHFCEKDLRTLVGVFSDLMEVDTGHCKNAVNRACGHFRWPLLIFTTSLRWPRDTVEMQ